MKFLPRMALAISLSAWPLVYAGAQQLKCTPANYDYGQVQVGAAKQNTFQLSNTGTRALTISAKHKNRKEFTFSGFKLPITLQPGQGAQMRVNFVPSITDTISGTLTLTSNAKNPTLSVGVSGTGVSGATLGVSPASLSFGSVTVGASSSLPLTLSASNGTVTISAAQINSSEFVLSGLTLPKSIAAGQSVTATVTFTPNASGTATANLTLTSNAVNSPTTVSLTGVGVAVKAHSADLTWSASPDPVVGYNIYRGGTKGGPYTKVNGVVNAPTNYTDSTVTAGVTYYYVVTAVDANDVESPRSNEAKAIIPTP